MEELRKPSLTRAIVAKDRWERAEQKVRDAQRLELKEKDRFVVCVGEAIADDRDVVNCPWLFHHLNNTLLLSQYQIKDIGSGETTLDQCLEANRKRRHEMGL